MNHRLGRAAFAVIVLAGAGATLGASGGCGDPQPHTAPQADSGPPDIDGSPGPDGAPNCWTLPTVTRARLYPRAGHAAQIAGGKIVGSNTSPTTAFTDLAIISTAAAEGQWLEVPIAHAAAYRYIKFYGAAGSHGDLAELELYAGTTKLDGTSFGTVASSTASDATHAFDGDPSTYYDGALPDDQYVGLDIGAAHATAQPAMDPAPSRFATPPTVSIKTATPGATIRYTTDGSDPHKGTLYTQPFTISTTSVVNAVAQHDCMLDSPVTYSQYSIGAASKKVQSIMNIGNSLTGNVWDVVPKIATSGGFQLAPTVCLSSGAGTPDLWNGTCDMGVSDLKSALQSQPFDNVTIQPFAYNPCTPSTNGGDAEYGNDFFGLAKKANAATQLWVFETWPQPTTSDWSTVDCFSYGGNPRTPPWIPPHPTTDWVSALDNHRAYHEAVRDGIEQLNPGGVKPRIIPGGLGLLALKKEIEAGHVPGTTNFFSTAFGANGTDLHLAPAGSYMVSLVMFACYFQQSPEGLGVADSGLTPAQALVYQKAAWQTVLDYPFAGMK